jgi:hypothetical protein
MKKAILVFLFFSSTVSAQYRRYDANRIGIGVGTNQFSLYTSSIEVKPGNGWNAGLSLRGNWYNNLDMVYGIQFSENNFSVAGETGNDVKYKLSSAQIFLTPSYKIIENHLSVEFGPMVQINGKLTYNKEFEDTIIEGTSLSVAEAAKVSRFNFYPTIGVTAGIKRIRIQATYQYAVNNLFAKTNQINARGGILAGNLIFYL